MELFSVLFAESLLFFASQRVDESSIQEIVFILLNIECAWKFVTTRKMTGELERRLLDWLFMNMNAYF